MARFSAWALLLLAACLAAAPPHARASGVAPDGTQRSVHDALQVRCFAPRLFSRGAPLRVGVHCPRRALPARTC
jgi:hypothetical protein